MYFVDFGIWLVCLGVLLLVPSLLSRGLARLADKATFRLKRVAGTVAVLGAIGTVGIGINLVACMNQFTSGREPISDLEVHLALGCFWLLVAFALIEFGIDKLKADERARKRALFGGLALLGVGAVFVFIF